MIALDVTLLIHIINILVLMYALNILLYKPVLGILEQRTQKMESLDGDAARFEDDVRARQAELDQRMRDAGSRAKKAMDAARAEAQSAGAAQLAKSRQEADAAKDARLAELKSEIEAARAALQEESGVFARAMAGKILGRSLDA
ncbi:MAG: ATP synthase F0 subunit B [Desulfobulbus sp.]|jgi:F-type H+-transporting ATPase subunit b